MSSNFQKEEDIKFIAVGKPPSPNLEDEDYQCGICSASFNSKSNLLEHVELKHRRNRKSREEQTPKIELKSCSNCRTKFRSDFDLYKHRQGGCQVQEEEGDPNMLEKIIQENHQEHQSALNECSKCGLNFKFRIQLLKHEKLHENARENSAEEPNIIVPNGSKKSSNSKRNKLSETEKSFPCPKSGCDFSSKCQANTKTNLRVRHWEGGEQIFKCDLCPFQTAFKSNLKQHGRSHSEEKPFACSFPKCDFRTRWSSNLKVHEGHHKDPKKAGRLKKSIKTRTPKILLNASKHVKKGEEVVQTPRTSSRQRSQIHHSLSEELLIQDFQLQNAVDFGTSEQETSQVSQDPEIDETSQPGTLSNFETAGAGMPELSKASYATQHPLALHHPVNTDTTSSDPFMLTSMDSSEPTTDPQQQQLTTSQDLENTETEIPPPLLSSDLPELGILELISPEDFTNEETEMAPPPAVATTTNQAQKKCKELVTKAIKTTGLKRNPTLSADQLQCPHCSYHTKAEWLLRGHLVGHGAAEPFYCSVENCDFQTKWQNYFYSHMRNVHSTRYHPPGKKLKSVKTAKSSGCQESQVTAAPSPDKPDHSPAIPVKSKVTKIVPKPRKDPNNSNLFLCPFPDCGFKTLYEFNMTRHFKTHENHGTLSYSCSECQGKFSNKVSLGMHQRHCSGQLPASSNPQLSRVFHKKKSGKLYTCSVPDCNFKTRIGRNFFAHRQSHKRHGSFAHTCTACQRKFATSAALLRHGYHCAAKTTGNHTMESSQAQELQKGPWYTCKFPDCNFKTRLRACIVGHRKSHDKYGIFNHACATCPRKFATSAALLRHESKCTRSIPSSSSLKSSQLRGKLYTCEVPDCNFKTRFTACILSHRKSHAKYGIFAHACANCPRKFATAAALLRHGPKCKNIITHQTSRTSSSSAPKSSQQVEQPTGSWLICDVADCNYKTRHRGTLWNHQRRHLKYGNFVHNCADCQRKFATPGALLRHRTMRTKTTGNCSSLQQHHRQQVKTARHVQSIRPPQPRRNLDNKLLKPPRTPWNNKALKCPECPYVAVTPTLLRRHSIVHTSKRPFACPLCPYSARWSGDLKKHQRRQHVNYATMEPKLSGKLPVRATNVPTNDGQGSGASEAASLPEELNKADCTFCSYMSRLAKYLTKHMTKCPGCHKSTNQTPPQVSSSALPALQVPSQNGPGLTLERNSKFFLHALPIYCSI